jgi:Tripartite tricarboxylate transporter TctB family
VNISVLRIDFKDLAFALFLIALALIAFGATGSLAVGTASDMGPGFVPRALAWIILGFGVGFLVTGFAKARAPIPLPAWRPLAAILASIALFAVLFAKLGLIAACVGAVVVAGTATSPVRWLKLIVFGLIIAAFSALLFVKGLGLPFKLWP